jgi:hypothetical protein
MKASAYRALSVAFFVALTLGVAAQLQAQTVVRADIPFDFSLGGQVYPSGTYSFTISSDSQSKLVLARSADGRLGRFMMAEVDHVSGPDDPVLRFNHFGDHYLLTSLWSPDTEANLTFAPNRAERELMFGAKQQEVVTVLARR